MFPVAALTMILASACHDSSPASPKTPPPPPPSGRGLIVGTVDARTNLITFTPVGAAPSYAGGADPSIYGNQGVTVSLYGVIDSVKTVAGVSKTWFIRVALRNLEPFPIGSNYIASAPPDTTGVFVFFGSPPVVTSPSGCACTVTVNSASGTANFDALSQKYYWYESRPSAVQASPGTDTTRGNPEWQFKASSDAVQGFTFVVRVQADWPPPYQTSWSDSWVAVTDSLPSDDGIPDWIVRDVVGDATMGAAAILGNEMVLRAGGNNASIYMSHMDSVGSMPVVMDIVMRDSTAVNQIQGVMGIMEPVGGKQVFVGVLGNEIEFVTFNESTGAFNILTGTTSCAAGVCADNHVDHSYSLRKFGTDSVSLCMDGVRKLKIDYSQLQATQPSFAKFSMTVGTRSSTSNNNTSYWTSISHTIGAGAPGGIASNGTCS
jgi:hypothetical protein